MRKAYLIDSSGAARRVLWDGNGTVIGSVREQRQGGGHKTRADYLPVPPGAQMVATGVTYERWCDVPRAWLGISPWWQSQRRAA